MRALFPNHVGAGPTRQSAIGRSESNDPERAFVNVAQFGKPSEMT